jgi:hypothetical protein
MTAQKAKPTCTITLKNWGCYKRVTISGTPVSMDVKRPTERITTWSEPSWFYRPLPVEINTVLAVGTEKVRMWP